MVRKLKSFPTENPCVEISPVLIAQLAHREEGAFVGVLIQLVNLYLSPFILEILRPSGRLVQHPARRHGALIQHLRDEVHRQ